MNLLDLTLELLPFAIFRYIHTLELLPFAIFRYIHIIGAPLLKAKMVTSNSTTTLQQEHLPANGWTTRTSSMGIIKSTKTSRNKRLHSKSNSSRWSKFHPLYQVIVDGVKIFSSLKYNLLQQFPYSPSQLVGPTMPRHPLSPSSKSRIFGRAQGGWARRSDAVGVAKPVILDRAETRAFYTATHRQPHLLS
jgi:hypothetical protein